MIDAQLLTFMRDSSRGYPSLSLKKDVFSDGHPVENCKTVMSSNRIYSMNGYASHSSMLSNNQQLCNQQYSYASDIGLQDALHQNGSYFHSMLPFGMPNPSLLQSEAALQEGGQMGVRYLYDTEGETCDSESEDDLMDEDDCDELDEYVFETEPDDPSKLLNFVQAVTRDLHSMFGRNKGSEDYCDIYEERFKTTLSGRDLYYADLLALASNSEAPSSRRRRSRLTAGNSAAVATSENFTPSPVSNCCSNSPAEVCGSEHTIIYDSKGEPQRCHLPHEGRCIEAYGLGPLEELFRNNATHCAPSTSSSSQVLTHFSPLNSYPEHDSFKSYNTYKSNDFYGTSAIPMTQRKLPNSFWVEPGIETKNVLLPTVSRTPDFSELFVQWGT